MSKSSSVCKICRRYHTKLFLKGERCNTPKCALIKRAYRPGIHGQARRRLSEYAVQLAEKQKAKATYGLREKQFKNYYVKAAKSKTNTGEKLIQQLEMRLDNVIYRLGFAKSRAQARQMVKHEKILVNNKKVTAPSYQIKIKDVIEPKDKKITICKTELPVWLDINKKKIQGEVVKLPEKQDITVNFSNELIIEYYNR